MRERRIYRLRVLFGAAGASGCRRREHGLRRHEYGGRLDMPMINIGSRNYSRRGYFKNYVIKWRYPREKHPGYSTQ